MLIRSPGGHLYYANVSTAQETIDFISTREVLPNIKWRVEQNGKPLFSLDAPLGSSPVTVLPAAPLPGGKGGFGSLLRSIGAQIEKTTNHEAMRDLSGRRQRDINNEQRLKEYVAKQSDREREQAERKEAKMEKLRRLAVGENVCKHDFHDPTYDKARNEATERVHDAIEAAFASGSSKQEEETSDPAATKRKSTEAGGPPKKKAGLWMGDGLDGLDDEDLSDSDEDSDLEAPGEKSKLEMVESRGEKSKLELVENK